MFCEESLGKINAKVIELFHNGSFHEFYRLKAFITLEQVNILLMNFSRIEALDFRLFIHAYSITSETNC